MATKLLTLTEDEIGEHFWIEAQVSPKLPQDKLILSQIAQAMRAPGADGKPMMSDRDIARFVLEYAYPDQIARNVELQMFESTDPAIQQLKAAAMAEKWKDANRETVRIAEKALNPDPDKEFEKMKKELTPESFKELVNNAAQAMHEEMMSGMAPDQFMQGALDQGAMMASMQDQMGRVPATVMPPAAGGPAPGPAPGPQPGAMPAQMMMGGAQAQTGVNPAAQIAEQTRRTGKPKPKKR